MRQTTQEIESAVLSFAEQEQDAGHPEIDQLIAYHEGRADSETHEAIQEHLALCRECTGLLLDFADFHRLEPASAEHRLTEARESALKDTLKERLKEGTPEPRTEVVAFPTRHAKPASRAAVGWKLILAQAAILLLALGGFWARSERPGVDVEVFHLRPDSVRGDIGESLQVPGWVKSYLLVLGSVRLEEEERFHLEILDAGGDLVASARDVRPSHDGTLKYRVPKRRLAAGRYEIRLFGSDPEEPLETYRLEIDLEAPE